MDNEHMKKLLSFSMLVLSVVCAAYAEDAPKPKYGPAGKAIATPLAQDSSYFRKSGVKAPDYWSMSPFYSAQFNDKACSVASVVTVLNAARVPLKKMSDVMNVRHEELLASSVGQVENWSDRVGEKGFKGEYGTDLKTLAKVTEASFKANGFPDVKVTAVHVEDQSSATLKRVRSDLIANERGSENYIIANFIQKAFTDDFDGGHISPVGAYDASKDRVLIMDVDRQWYEPYWVSFKDFVAGMNTKDKGANAYRGYIKISVR